MASTEIEILDPTATVEKLTKIAANRSVNRRRFMAAFGMTSAAHILICKYVAAFNKLLRAAVAPVFIRSVGT